METGFDHIRRVFNDLKDITFWDRLFRWNRVRNLLIEGAGDLQRLLTRVESFNKISHDLELEKSRNKAFEESLAELKILRQEKESLLKEKSALESKNEIYLKRGTELSAELGLVKSKLEFLENEIKQAREENTKFKSTEDQKKLQYENLVNNLNKTIERLQTERDAEKRIQHQKEIDRIRSLKETWSRHEENVKARIKAICSKHGVDYLDTVPFKGKPDNTIRINEEYIIFDAKSPAGDDLTNFPLYLRNQSESVSKYIKEEGVRREVFLVVPTNTLEILEQVEYRLSDYTAYVISIDSLEPIIIALRKIEDYEFAEQLSPEERENICRVIGKFVHLSKRRIQIDGFFAKQFFELVYRSEADLPKDILQKAIDFEKSEKLNPPIERRARQISNKELEIEIRERKTDAEQKGIEMDDSMLSKNLNKLPLYTDPKEETQRDLFK